ncbi:MAG: hypothetical protein C0598_14385 [Marinilabiliales bacterium]|nr:MAG: hypothetical protein C0598_14385 [Marinilabiliales bacterium]
MDRTLLSKIHNIYTFTGKLIDLTKAMENKNLYAILLGGKIRKNHLMEDHHLVFVVAENEKEARKLAKKKWVVEEVHVDGTQLIKRVDGYEVSLKKSSAEGSDFEINPNYSL